MKWWKHKDAAELNLALDMFLLHVRGGYRLAANVEAVQVERLTGVNANDVHQMFRELSRIENGEFGNVD